MNLADAGDGQGGARRRLGGGQRADFFQVKNATGGRQRRPE